MELAVAARGARVYGYDAFDPLVLFWQSILDDPASLARLVRKHHPLPREGFYDLQEKMRSGQLKDQQAAAIFFVLNRSSFSGTTLSGGMSPGHQRFTPSAIERLEQFKIDNLSVNKADFTESIPRHPNDVLYCDPPYANGGALYGERGDCHTDFDHEALAALLRNRDGWVLSYNDCALVRDLYQGCVFVPVKWIYGMSIDKKSNEVLILSSDLKGSRS